MRYFVTVDDQTLEVEIGPEGLRVDGRPVEAELLPIVGTDQARVRIAERSHRVAAQRLERGRWHLHLDGRPATIEVVDERTRAIRELTRASAAAAGPRPIKAPMPGLVVRVEVDEGDAVQEGQGVVIVEAMKMENELTAEAPARVKRVLVKAGDTVVKDQPLIEFDTLDEEGEA